jgi:hypothetical protein
MTVYPPNAAVAGFAAPANAVPAAAQQSVTIHRGPDGPLPLLESPIASYCILPMLRRHLLGLSRCILLLLLLRILLLLLRILLLLLCILLLCILLLCILLLCILLLCILLLLLCILLLCILLLLHGGLHGGLRERRVKISYLPCRR